MDIPSEWLQTRSKDMFGQRSPPALAGTLGQWMTGRGLRPGLPLPLLVIGEHCACLKHRAWLILCGDWYLCLEPGTRLLKDRSHEWPILMAQARNCPCCHNLLYAGLVKKRQQYLQCPPACKRHIYADVYPQQLQWRFCVCEDQPTVTVNCQSTPLPLQAKVMLIDLQILVSCSYGTLYRL